MSALGEKIDAILRSARTIAVIGLSDKPDRPSFGVARYLQRFFNIIPVNPNLTTWQGLPCYPSLSAIPPSQQVDVVDIFRASEAVPPIVDEAIARQGVKLIWMQEGVVHDEAKARAEAAGIPVVMDACLAVVHAQLRG